MSDNAVATAQNLDAPAGERFDAQAELTKSSLADQLIPAEDLRPVIAHIQEIMFEQDLAKASRGTNVVQFPGAVKRSSRGPQSVFLDDMQIQTQGEYWDRPGILGFDSMRAMVDQTPLLNGIVMTRMRQVSRFCRPQSSRTDTGFAIQHVDPTVDLNDAQQNSIDLLQGFMTNCGWEMDPRRRKRLKRDTFAQFMAMSVRDSLTMDAAPIETMFKRDRMLGLDGFVAADGASIRLCTEHGYEGDDEIFAVQVLQGRIRTAYNYDQLVYEVRNPRTDVTARGYGYSETEMLIRVVTYLLNTMTYNGSFFDKNSIPRGLLNVYGNIANEDLAVFKRQWNAMVRGVANAHNLPVLVSKDQESGSTFTEIGGQLSEMAFAKWMSFLTSVACAIYGIAPEEVSMESFATQGKGIGGNDTEEKLVSSNDKGLRPLLGYYEALFSDYILQPFSKDYVFRFVGLDAEDSKQRFERQKLASTWNELRAIDGQDPIPGKLGKMPVNPALIPTWSAETGVGQPQQDFGDPDAEGGDGDPVGGDEGDAFGGGGPGGDGEGQPDFGAPTEDSADEGEAFGKALAPDFGMPPLVIYAIEGS